MILRSHTPYDQKRGCSMYMRVNKNDMKNTEVCYKTLSISIEIHAQSGASAEYRDKIMINKSGVDTPPLIREYMIYAVTKV